MCPNRKHDAGPIRFALVGCGRIAYRHIEAIQENPRAELVALCDLNLETAKERAGDLAVKLYQNYNEMLSTETIDVVGIMTPSGMHAEHTLEIITKHKVHIVLEKPIALRIEDGIELIRCADQNAVRIFAVHQNRFNKAVQKIRSAVEENAFGKLALGTIRIRWSRPQSYYDRAPWRGTFALDGGALANQAIHHIDLLQWLMGPVKSVSAVANTNFVNVEVEDLACAWLRFENGSLGSIEVTTAVRPSGIDLEASVSILGERGMVIAEGASVNRLTIWTVDESEILAFSENPPNVYGYGHNRIIDNVVSTLYGETEPLVTATDALTSVRLLHAIYASIENSGKEVFLKDNPTSTRLGNIGPESQHIADLYRTRGHQNNTSA